MLLFLLLILSIFINAAAPPSPLIDSLESLLILLRLFLFSFGGDFVGIEPRLPPQIRPGLHQQFARLNVAQKHGRVQ